MEIRDYSDGRWISLSRRELVHEAAAYAAFAGKPATAYHWHRAAGLSRFGDILTLSNFSGKGPAVCPAVTTAWARSALRHGGQREGMVLDRNEPRPISRGRRVERTKDKFATYDARGPSNGRH